MPTIADVLQGELVRLVPVDELQPPEEVQDLFNSRPDWVVATRDRTPDERYELDDAEMFLWQHLSVEDGYLLRVELYDGRLQGVVAGMVGGQGGSARIGLLLVSASADPDAVVPEALDLLERRLAETAREVRFSVLDDWPVWRPYLTARGYTDLGPATDQDNRRVHVFEKSLTGAGGVDEGRA